MSSAISWHPSTRMRITEERAHAPYKGCQTGERASAKKSGERNGKERAQRSRHSRNSHRNALCWSRYEEPFHSTFDTRPRAATATKERTRGCRRRWTERATPAFVAPCAELERCRVRPTTHDADAASPALTRAAASWQTAGVASGADIQVKGGERKTSARAVEEIHVGNTHLRIHQLHARVHSVGDKRQECFQRRCGCVHTADSADELERRATTHSASRRRRRRR